MRPIINLVACASIGVAAYIVAGFMMEGAAGRLLSLLAGTTAFVISGRVGMFRHRRERHPWSATPQQRRVVGWTLLIMQVSLLALCLLLGWLTAR
jgi:hypothetical protein